MRERDHILVRIAHFLAIHSTREKQEKRHAEDEECTCFDILR